MREAELSDDRKGRGEEQKRKGGEVRRGAEREAGEEEGRKEKRRGWPREGRARVEGRGRCREGRGAWGRERRGRGEKGGVGEGLPHFPHALRSRAFSGPPTVNARGRRLGERLLLKSLQPFASSLFRKSLEILEPSRIVGDFISDIPFPRGLFELKNLSSMNVSLWHIMSSGPGYQRLWWTG